MANAVLLPASSTTITAIGYIRFLKKSLDLILGCQKSLSLNQEFEISQQVIPVRGLFSGIDMKQANGKSLKITFGIPKYVVVIIIFFLNYNNCRRPSPQASINIANVSYTSDPGWIQVSNLSAIDLYVFRGSKTKQTTGYALQIIMG